MRSIFLPYLFSDEESTEAHPQGGNISALSFFMVSELIGDAHVCLWLSSNSPDSQTRPIQFSSIICLSYWVKKSMEMTVEGNRGRGRPKMTLEKVVERDMKVRGLVRNDAKDGVKWRALSWGTKANSHNSGKNGLKMFVVVVVVVVVYLLIIRAVLFFSHQNQCQQLLKRNWRRRRRRWTKAKAMAIRHPLWSTRTAVALTMARRVLCQALVCFGVTKIDAMCRILCGTTVNKQINALNSWQYCLLYVRRFVNQVSFCFYIVVALSLEV